MNSDQLNDQALANAFRPSPEQEAINAAAWREHRFGMYGPSGRPPPRQRHGETLEEFQARAQGLPHPQAEARAERQAQARAQARARSQALAQPQEATETPLYKGSDINGGKKSRRRRRTTHRQRRKRRATRQRTTHRRTRRR